jgi:thiol-disulfide isomerase/thioredoxin
MAQTDDLPDFSAYSEELVQHPYVVVKFGYSSCPPCNKLKPILELIKNQTPDYIHYIDVDIIKQDDIAAEEDVSRVPLIRFYIKNVKQADLDIVGFNVDKLQANFNSFLEKVYAVHADQNTDGK